MSTHKSLEFLALQKQWYEKLKESGFNDAEQDEDHLKRWRQDFIRPSNTGTAFENAQEYYYMATHFLNDYIFKKPKYKFIWACHADALTVRQIEEKAKEHGMKISKALAHLMIKTLSKEMFKLYGVCK